MNDNNYSAASYARHVGTIETDWLKELREVKPDDATKLFSLREFARQWPTCAVGNQCWRLPRDEDGRPLDSRLAELGIDFSIEVFYLGNSVDEDHFEENRREAIDTLLKIEQRSAELLANL